MQERLFKNELSCWGERRRKHHGLIWLLRHSLFLPPGRIAGAEEENDLSGSSCCSGIKLETKKAGTNWKRKCRLAPPMALKAVTKPAAINGHEVALASAWPYSHLILAAEGAVGRWISESSLRQTSRGPLHPLATEMIGITGLVLPPLPCTSGHQDGRGTLYPSIQRITLTVLSFPSTPFLGIMQFLHHLHCSKRMARLVPNICL